MAMPPVAHADGHSGSHIHRRNEGRDSVAFVIVGLPGGDARSQWQNRLRAILSLDLALLIHTQHDRTIRWVEEHAYDIPHLLHELGVFGELEVLYPMRLDPAGTPDTTVG